VGGGRTSSENDRDSAGAGVNPAHHSVPSVVGSREAINARHRVLARMDDLATQGIDCSCCATGRCCTFAANSMKITPCEALDIVRVMGRNRIAELMPVLENSIRTFRLDVPLPGDGKRSFARRRYTCPFFDPKTPSCTVPRVGKPLGCLAFNPKTTSVRDGENCSSDAPLLELAHQDLPARLHERNTSLAILWQWAWETAPIPIAVIDAFNHSLREDFYDE